MPDIKPERGTQEIAELQALAAMSGDLAIKMVSLPIEKVRAVLAYIDGVETRAAQGSIKLVAADKAHENCVQFIGRLLRVCDDNGCGDAARAALQAQEGRE